jgi:hypothetical protein
MFNFNKVHAPQKINREFILSKVTDAQIFGYYHGPFKMGQVYTSKLRPDRNPSCGFYISKAGKLIYNDLAKKGENYDCFAFVGKMYGISFADTIKKIASDFGLATGIKSPEVHKVMKQLADFDKSFKKQTRIHFRPAKWTDENLAYWKDYHITKKELEENGIFAIKDLFINDYGISNKDNENRYALTLDYKGEMLTKIYAPGSSGLRWITNIPLEIPFGMDSLTNSAFSFGAKAQKDRLVLRKFIKSVYATQNESEGAMSSKTIRTLMFNYQENYLGWDPDEKGLAEMAAMEPKGFTSLHMPQDLFEQEGIKDYADLAKVKGLKGVEEFLKKNKLI